MRPHIPTGYEELIKNIQEYATYISQDGMVWEAQSKKYHYRLVLKKYYGIIVVDSIYRDYIKIYSFTEDVL